MNIQIKRCGQYAGNLPSYATTGSAGMDLHAAIEEQLIIPAGGIVMVPPTGLHANVANTLIGRIMDKSIINKIGNKDYQSVIMDVIKCPGNAKIFALSMT